MKRATRFMADEASVGGGYVWSALPDFSRRWGELEAKPTMIWVQPPGTGTMVTERIEIATAAAGTISSACWPR